jgi:hypothetical protein
MPRSSTTLTILPLLLSLHIVFMACRCALYLPFYNIHVSGCGSSMAFLVTMSVAEEKECLFLLLL